MFALLSMAVCCLVSPAASPPDSVIAFVNVSVIPMDRERVLPSQTVLVEGERIIVVGPTKSVKVPAHARRIDGTGKFLIPGLADMHVHGGSERVFATYLAHGITTIRIMEGGPTQLALREQVKRGEILGPTIYTAGSQIRNISSPEMAVKIVEKYKADGYDFIKMRNPSLTLEVLDSFVAAARRFQIPFEGHVPRGEVTLTRWLEAKPRSVEHFDSYLAALLKAAPAYQGNVSLAKIVEGVENGGITYRDSSLAAVVSTTKRLGVWNVPTFVVAQTSPQFPDEAREGWKRINFRILKTVHDSGAGLLVGTDANVEQVPPGPSFHTELQLLVEGGLTPYQALEAGTRNSALFWGTEAQTGTVEAGKQADLVLLSSNPLENIGHTRQPLGVMVRGRWLPREDLDARLTALEVPASWR